jgi:DNA-directed RNA polymerase subunit RPC12/RpoP
MSRSTYFVQECPTCGRNLQVRVHYLGKQVVCQHCGARFEAYDASSGAIPPPSSSLSVLARAEELLQSTAASGVGAPGLTTDVVPMPARPR